MSEVSTFRLYLLRAPRASPGGRKRRPERRQQPHETVAHGEMLMKIIRRDGESRRFFCGNRIPVDRDVDAPRISH